MSDHHAPDCKRPQSIKLIDVAQRTRARNRHGRRLPAGEDRIHVHCRLGSINLAVDNSRSPADDLPT